MINKIKRLAKTILRVFSYPKKKKSSSLIPHLKHLGDSPKDQRKKNKAAIKWAKERLKETRKSNR